MPHRTALALDAALALAAGDVPVPPDTAIVAPTLLRSDALAALYAEVRAGRMTREEAAARLDRFRTLRIRLLGDRVAQAWAWRIADALGWDDTRPAEYVAVAKLQADVLITDDADLAKAAQVWTPTAPPPSLARPTTQLR